MHLASWTLLLMLLTCTVQGYDDDDSLLEKLAEQMESRHRPHQQHGWGGSSRGRTPASSAVGGPPPASPPVADFTDWRGEDEDAQAGPGLPRGTEEGHLEGGGGGGGRGGKETPGGRHQSSSPHAAAAAAELMRASSTSSRPPHRLFSSVTAVERRARPTRRRKTSRVPSTGTRGLLAQSVCPSQTQWKQLMRARDINSTFVEVFQPSDDGVGGGGGQRAPGDAGRRSQWFYTVSCLNQAFRSKRRCQDCCIGIDDTRYTSSCEQKHSYVMAYVRRPWQTKFHWNLISVNSSCNCAITSIHNDF